MDIPPGYQLLNGTNALAFARYRHTDSDFYRNARQQVFLHAFSQRASSQLHGIGLDQLTTLRDVAETIAKNVQVTGPNGPPSVQTMIEMATTAYAIKDRVITSRLNATVAGDATNSYVEATPEAMRAAVFAFTHPGEHEAAHQHAAGQGRERPQGAQVQAQGRPHHDAADHGQRERHAPARPPEAAPRWGRGATR